MPDPPRPLIFGPAYLDRVVRVDRPLVNPDLGVPPLDGSVNGRWLGPGEGLHLLDPSGHRLVVELPGDWPGPTGSIEVSRTLGGPTPWARGVRSTDWQDDLGGMGAGFASALGGDLICALGPESDPTGQSVLGLLARQSISHRALRVDHPSDWTLLITSGEHGDKLPIGFRGCHARLPDLGDWAGREAPVRVVAALPNRLSALGLQGPSPIRAFAPTLRNMLDRDPPISGFAGSIDLLTCNRREWEQLADREQVAWQVSILIVTDGPNGATVRFTSPEGEAERLTVPVFPRDRPPLDTNRAGEAFAAAFLSTLLDHDWAPGVTAPDLARLASDRAAVAAALVLGRVDFGFPTPGEVDRAIRIGRIP